MKLKFFLTAILVGFLSFSCSDKDDVSVEPQLIIKFKFDPNQVRLDNLGQPVFQFQQEMQHSRPFLIQ